MLELTDLNLELDKATYKEKRGALRLRLGALQRRALEAGLPVLIVFEGWDAAGKGTLINRLILNLDPRGYEVHPISAPESAEKRRPWMWRFWRKTPAAGRMAIFDRSWYGRVLVARVDKLVRKPVWQAAYQDILDFERQLHDDGALIVKYFLHISEKEQKKRFKKLEKNPKTAWKVTKEDWRHHKERERYLEAIEEMLARTDTEFAPWTVVEAHDRRHATVKVMETLAQRLELALARREQADEPPREALPEGRPRAASVLDQADLDLSLEREEYEKRLDAAQERVRDLEHEIYLRQIPVVVVYEGADAGGKGGNIRRLVAGMDPRGYRVVPIAAPNDVEKRHHYLWRFWREVPKTGHIAIFDRSWYGRVLVERVEGFATVPEWERAYREINEMEAQWADFGTVIVKFWLEISKAEQLQRFEARQNTPHKRWKITDEDWRNREKWDLYREVVNEMLFRTSTARAPWTVIEGNCKLHARVKALETVCEAIEAQLD